jgi:hypothetical protein
MGRYLAVVALLSLVACGAKTDQGSVQSTADTVTKAVYNNDVDGVTTHFDDRLRTDVSRGEVGTLSDKMHSFGDYKGLTYLSGDPAKNEFTYRADFDKGSMNVVVRADDDGRLAAYRVFPLR